MTWQVALISALVTGVLTLLGFWLARNQKSSQLASNAMMAMGQNLEFQLNSARVIEKMRTAMYLQGERLNAWEDWGLDSVQVMRTWRRYLLGLGNFPNLPDMPKPPEGHLDMSQIFSDEDIKAMRQTAEQAEQLKQQIDSSGPQPVLRDLLP